MSGELRDEWVSFATSKLLALLFENKVESVYYLICQLIGSIVDSNDLKLLWKQVPINSILIIHWLW